ncbi:MAG: Ig-like domain-containing protein, partial [Trueperaceae bacterium]
MSVQIRNAIGFIMVLVLVLVACADQGAPDDGDADTTQQGMAVGFTGLSDGQAVSPDHVFTVRASSDARVTEITIEFGGQTIELEPRGSNTLRLSDLVADDLEDGAYTLVVSVTDSEDRTAEASVAFSVDASAPVTDPGDDVDDDAVVREVRAFLTSPTGGVVSGDVDVIAVVETRNVNSRRVSFFLDGTLIDEEPTIESMPSTGEFVRQRYTVSWDTTEFADGDVEVSVVAETGDGVVSATASVEVTVANEDVVDPDLSWMAPASDSTVSGAAVTLQVEATDDVGVDSVRFYVSGSLVGDGVAAGDEFSFDWDSTSVPDGSVSIEARASDAAGNVTSESLSVTVANADTVAPSVSWMAPASDSTVSGAAVTLQ